LADRISGRENWKLKFRSRYYSAELLLSVIRELDFEKKRRFLYENQRIGSYSSSHMNGIHSTRDHLTDPNTNDTIPPPQDYIPITLLINTLRSCITKAMNGIMNEHLYSQSFMGTKVLIEEYLEAIQEALVEVKKRTIHSLYAPKVVSKRPESYISEEEVLQFFKSIKASYGNTALCLSGGASLGNIHFGVIQTLLNHDCLPKVISGTSSGAIVAAVICTRTDLELKEILQPEHIIEHLDSFQSPISERIHRFLREGCLFDQQIWLEKLQWFTKSLTFLEAYRHTGRILNVTVTAHQKHSPPLILNYITTPNVTIASALLGSCAIPLLIPSVTLLEKFVVQGRETIRPFHHPALKFKDGSFETDLPLSHLSEMFNVSFFIVSQVKLVEIVTIVDVGNRIFVLFFV